MNAEVPIRPATVTVEVTLAESEIERTREEVVRSVLALRRALSRRTNWREWVGRRPLFSLGVVFAIGLVGGLKSGRQRSMKLR
jgi:hypothetical protein